MGNDLWSFYICICIWYNPGYISIELAVYTSIEYTSIKTESEAASFFLPNVIQWNNKILQPDFLFVQI